MDIKRYGLPKGLSVNKYAQHPDQIFNFINGLSNYNTINENGTTKITNDYSINTTQYGGGYECEGEIPVRQAVYLMFEHPAFNINNTDNIDNTDNNDESVPAPVPDCMEIDEGLQEIIEEESNNNSLTDKPTMEKINKLSDLFQSEKEKVKDIVTEVENQEESSGEGSDDENVKETPSYNKKSMEEESINSIGGILKVLKSHYSSLNNSQE